MLTFVIKFPSKVLVVKFKITDLEDCETKVLNGHVLIPPTTKSSRAIVIAFNQHACYNKDQNLKNCCIVFEPLNRT